MIPVECKEFDMAVKKSVLSPTAIDASSATGTTSARLWVNEALLGLAVRGKLLAQIKTIDALRVHIASDGQDATLTGELVTPSHLELAELLTRSVQGIRQVRNQLTCAADGAAFSATDYAGIRVINEIKDALLETRIKTNLLAEGGAGTFKIEVKAVNGVVKLSGTVPDLFHHDEAMRITRETSTVIEVRDLLKIKPRDSVH